MKITSSIEYATRLMVQLARVHGEQPLSADKLSRSENVPADYVNQLLLRLKRGGLVESRRGSGGGYTLSRPPAEVRLGDILRAVEGPIFENVCEKYAEDSSDCRHQAHCGISPVWQKLGALIEGYFDGITLDTLLDDAPGACGRVEAMLHKIPQDGRSS
jgi:Rrf2 family protein